MNTDLTCVHMTALSCLVRNANTWIIHGNSLSLETWGGYHVRRTWAGGELHQLTPEDAARIIRLPFAKPEASTGAFLARSGPGANTASSNGPGALSRGPGRARRRGPAVHSHQAGTGRFGF